MHKEGGAAMENHEDLWMQYMKQRTENSRELLSKTGLVVGCGFGPGVSMLSTPLFGMMLVSSQTGVYDFKSLTSPADGKPCASYSNTMLNLWDMALNSNPPDNKQS